MAQGEAVPAILSLKDKEDFPEIFHTADAGAISSQKWHLFFVRFELIFISLAAVAEVFGHQIAPLIVSIFNLHVGDVTLLGRHFTAEDVTTSLASNITAGVFMLIAIVLYGLRFALRRDHRWLGRRALAEATKGLAWRYSMRAMRADLHSPNPLTADEAHKAFLDELSELEQQSFDLHLSSPKPGDVQLTPRMEALRQATPTVQKQAYIEDRLKEQQDWYARKATNFEHWTTRLQLARGGAYVLGVLLLLFNLVGTNGISAATTIAGALATWLASKRYEDLSQSYGAMARKLIGLKNLAPNISSTSPSGTAGSQTSWATFVDEVETLLDGEHREWLRNTR